MRAGDLVLRTGERETVLVPDPTAPHAFTLRVGRTDQSYVDLDDPTRLEFDYVQRIVDVVDSVAPAGERLGVVHVGGAALTLPRYLAHTRPRSAQVVLEPDAELTELVRSHLPLPRQSGIKVRAADGLTGLAALRDDYADLVILDAFDGSRVPAELTTAEFLADVRRVLRPGGTLVMNVTDRGPFDYARRVLAGVLATFDHVVFSAEPSTLKGRRFGNVVIAAAAAALPVEEIARRAGSAPYPYRVLQGARLTQLVGGAAPFTATDGAPSPAPPADLLFG
ncbi:Spermidine synthase [Friedmanniella luteola]|uniref:Spermidine synthase n=1 Tax=Friedmanniella luteola TaxID=546871 RepID=A0A1H1ZTV3_9ACTN|nr:fused MFS/spermidine synthase [Friedmanniella luteola]SDT37251.1 Spermidine synthase [Friedmanniella luteola]